MELPSISKDYLRSLVLAYCRYSQLGVDLTQLPILCPSPSEISNNIDKHISDWYADCITNYLFDNVRGKEIFSAIDFAELQSAIFEDFVRLIPEEAAKNHLTTIEYFLGLLVENCANALLDLTRIYDADTMDYYARVINSIEEVAAESNLQSTECFENEQTANEIMRRIFTATEYSEYFKRFAEIIEMQVNLIPNYIFNAISQNEGVARCAVIKLFHGEDIIRIAQQSARNVRSLFYKYAEISGQRIYLEQI